MTWATSSVRTDPRKFRPTRCSPRRCPGLQTLVRDDLFDDWLLQDGGNDLHLATAVRTVLRVSFPKRLKVARDHAVHDLQHRRHQLTLCSQQHLIRRAVDRALLQRGARSAFAGARGSV